jgi:hypothetical protein
MRWSKRIGIGAGIAAGAIALSVGTGLAATPLASSESGGGSARSSAAGVPGVLTVSEAKAHSGEDGQSASWSPVSVAGQSPIERTPTGWSGPAGAVGAVVVDALNGATCPSGGVQVANANLCARVLSSYAVTDEDGSQSYGDFAEAYVHGPDTFVVLTVLESHAASRPECEGGFATPNALLVVNGDHLVPLHPLGSDLSGTCFVTP